MWPAFPKRLQSALKALCSLARSGREMQSHEISGEINVSNAETAKILQLLVWGGFVASRRGSKGGFHLALPAEQVTMAEVIDFFLARHPPEPNENSPVMRVLWNSIAPCQKNFGKLTLAEVASPKQNRRTKKEIALRVAQRQASAKKSVVRRKIGHR